MRVDVRRDMLKVLKVPGTLTRLDPTTLGVTPLSATGPYFNEPSAGMAVVHVAVAVPSPLLATRHIGNDRCGRVVADRSRPAADVAGGVLDPGVERHGCTGRCLDGVGGRCGGEPAVGRLVGRFSNQPAVDGLAVGRLAGDAHVHGAGIGHEAAAAGGVGHGERCDLGNGNAGVSLTLIQP